MSLVPKPLITDRLRLRPWRAETANAFAAMNRDDEVMRDLGGPIDRAACDAKLQRFQEAFETVGFGRWCVERLADDSFVGYVGMMPHIADHPLGAHVDLGWRLVRSMWGEGFATEAATAAIVDGFERIGIDEIVAYTAADNVRSQAVMERLGLRRDPVRDFAIADDVLGSWDGLVWAVTDPSLDDEAR